MAGWLVLFLLDAFYTYHGTVLQAPDKADSFTLVGANGQPVSLTDFRGKAVLIYFGYTICPDVCPATLTELARAKDSLGKDSDKIQVIMVTVDPQRDTPMKLAKYVIYFDLTS
jgi:protein SCO1/2